MTNEKLFQMLTLNLQHFAEGGEGGTSAEGATGVIETASESQEGENAITPDGENDGGIDLDAEFEQSIKGKYKDAFNKRTQSIVSERVKKIKGENASLTAKITAATPILEELAFRYGVDLNDTNALLSALKADTAFDEQKAFEEGTTLEERLKAKREARAKQQQEDELRNLRRQLQEQNDKQKFLEKYREWDSHSETIRATYPSYDLRTAMQNPVFVTLLNSGANPKNAYEAAYHDDIMAAAMQGAVNIATKKVADSVRANGKRPIENGNSSQGAITTKVDVSTLNREQMDFYIREAQKGKKITFRD